MKSAVQINSALRQSIAWGILSLFGLGGCANYYNPYQQYAYPQSYMQIDSYTGSGAPQILSNPQLESLVSPIALYPDSLLSLMLLASTYPLEVAEAYNWRNSNASLKGVDLQNALKTQSWNDSVKSLMTFPQAFNMMGSQLQWTQNLGNAYKLQSSDTMKAIQSLRKRALQAGTLKSTPQMTVTTDASANILLAPSSPQLVYVPTYSPAAVYGTWPYPDYPPYPAYNPAWGPMAFGLGLAVGDAFWAYPAWSNGTINATNVNTNPSRGLIGPSNVQNQQRLLNDWGRNASPQDRQDLRNAGQRADSTFQRDATPQERAQADRLNQETRNAYQQDRASPNVYREAAQENAFREQARFDGGQDRMGATRMGGGYGGGFGGGHMGGFRR